jgi:hypothetical protein
MLIYQGFYVTKVTALRLYQISSFSPKGWVLMVEENVMTYHSRIDVVSCDTTVRFL